MHYAIILMSLLACGGIKSVDPEKKERIVLVGDTLIEREQRYGYLETALRSGLGPRKLRIRNLGWGGDTPGGVARTYFDPPSKGPAELAAQIAAARPTMLVVGYGMSDSLEDVPAATFVEQLNRMLTANAPVPTILLTPIRHEDLGPPWPDPTAHQRLLMQYAAALERFAFDRKSRFIDLQAVFSPERRWTENGIHLSEAGYWYLALEIEKPLDIRPKSLAVDLVPPSGPNAPWTLAKPSEVQLSASPANQRGFVLNSPLPTVEPPVPGLTHPQMRELRLRIRNLAPGMYTLRVDGKARATASASEWDRGVILRDTAAHQRAAELRRLVREKDRLYFQRFRPQNYTYLLSFRQYEQGQNTKEIAALDADIERLEQRLDQAAGPTRLECDLVREKDQ